MENIVKENAEIYGCRVLTDVDLLTMILGGKAAESDAKIAVSMDSGGIASLLKMASPKILRDAGCTKTGALKLSALAELSKRMTAPEPGWSRSMISKPEDVVDYYRGNLDMLQSHEEMHIMYLNSAASLLREETLTVGGLNKCLMDRRRMLKNALSLDACSVIMVHNHPSGNIEPSDDDIEATKEALYALQMCGINFLDHIIVSKGKYFSFKRECDYLWDEFDKKPYKVLFAKRRQKRS